MTTERLSEGVGNGKLITVPVSLERVCISSVAMIHKLDFLKE